MKVDALLPFVFFEIYKIAKDVVQ